MVTRSVIFLKTAIFLFWRPHIPLFGSKRGFFGNLLVNSGTSVTLLPQNCDFGRNSGTSDQLDQLVKQAAIRGKRVRPQWSTFPLQIVGFSTNITLNTQVSLKEPAA